MTTLRMLLAASMLSSLPVTAALAQPEQAAPAGGALATERVPNTTAVGQTKPPSREASPASVKPIERLTPRQVSDDAIASRVCVGCGTEPATADPLSLRIRPTGTAEGRAARPDAPEALAAPRQQSDLDTVALASAHRERAESVEEKTNGLWQSWLVSVCDGCGDQKPARALRLEDWPVRTLPLTTGSVGHKAAPETKPVAEAKRPESRPHGTLEANLSPENVDSIRRMPQR